MLRASTYLFPITLAVCAATFAGCGRETAPQLASLPGSAQSASADQAFALAPAAVPQYHGCPVFAAGDAYNRAVTGAAVDPRSGAYIDSVNSHGGGQGFAFYVVNPAAMLTNQATGGTILRRVDVKSFHKDDFPKPVPWADNFFIERQIDHHAIVVNISTCTLYEMYSAEFNGTLSAYSGWEWNMRAPFVGTSKRTPPPGTSNPSSMASGLSEFAGAFREDDLVAGSINHALNFAPPVGSIGCSAIVWPATSTGGCAGYPPAGNAMPFGAHLRLRSSFTLSCGGSCPQSQMVVRAMKAYGIYLSDTGSHGVAPQMFVMPDHGGSDRFNSDDLARLVQIHITDFEVLKP